MRKNVPGDKGVLIVSPILIKKVFLSKKTYSLKILEKAIGFEILILMLIIKTHI